MAKTKVQYEYNMHCLSEILYEYLASAEGLSEWFADNVNSRGEFFTFIWDDSEEKAKLASKKSGERIKFKWLEEDGTETDYFFEMKILEDEITKDVSIVISDFAHSDELEESKLLWENQISDLKHVLGSV